MTTLKVSATLVLDTSHFTQQLAAAMTAIQSLSTTATQSHAHLSSVFNVDTRPFSRQLSDAREEMQSLSTTAHKSHTELSNVFSVDTRSFNRQLGDARTEIQSLSTTAHHTDLSSVFHTDNRAFTRQLSESRAALQSLSTQSQHIQPVSQNIAAGFQNVASQIEQGTRNTQKLGTEIQGARRSLESMVQVAGGLYVLNQAKDYLVGLPKLGIQAAASIETMKLGLAGTLASMGQIEGKALDIAQAQALATYVTGQLQKKAMETAASTDELANTYRALIGPGLAAKMTMAQLVELTSVGVNAVKSMGLASNQYVQELRDIVAGGIQPASSTLATALGITDKDIKKIKDSGGDLFKFLMDRLKGFEQTSLLYSDTYSGRLDALKEGVSKVAQLGFEPVFNALKTGFKDSMEVIGNFETAVIRSNGEVKKVEQWRVDPAFVDGVKNVAQMLVSSGEGAIYAAKLAYEYRDALTAIGIAYAAMRGAQMSGALVSGWAERIQSAQQSIIADRNAAAAALQRAEVEAATAQGIQRRALVEREAAMAISAKAQADFAAANAAVAAAEVGVARTNATIALTRAELARVAATEAATVATATLSQAEARAALASTELAAAQVRVAATSTAAGLASRGFGAVVGALGGPVGIAIVALGTLAMNWDWVKEKAFGAAASVESSANRIRAALSESNISAANAGVESLQAAREKIRRDIANIDATLREDGTSDLDRKVFKERKDRLSAQLEEIRGVILKSTADIEKAKKDQAKSALSLLEGYGSDAIERRYGLKIKADDSSAQALNDAMNGGLTSRFAEEPDQKKAKKAKVKDFADGAKEQADARAAIETERLQIALLEKHGLAYEKLAEGQKRAAKLRAEAAAAANPKAAARLNEQADLAEQLGIEQQRFAQLKERLTLEKQFAESAAQRAQTQSLLNEETQKEWEWMGLTATERAKAQAAWEEEKSIRTELLELQQKMVEAVGSESRALIQKQIDFVRSTASQRQAQAAERAEARAAQAEWSKITSDVSQAMTNSLAQGLQNGRGAIDSFFDYLKNTARTTVIKIAMQPVESAITSIGSQIFSGAQGGRIDPISAASGIYDAYKMGGESYTSAIKNALLSDTGASLGLSTGATYSVSPTWSGAGGFDSALVKAPGELTALGDAANVAGQALAYLPTVMSAANGQWGASAGAALGTYLTAGNPIGGMIGQQLGGLVDGFFGGGGPDERKAKFGSGASSALVAEGKQTGWTGESVFGTFRTYDDQWFGAEMQPEITKFVSQIAALDNSIGTALHLTNSQTEQATQALNAIDKTYSFGEQWTDFTQSSKAREQIAIDRYSAVLNSVEAGWGDFLTSFSGTFDQFPTYLMQIAAAMEQFRTNKDMLVDLFGEPIKAIGDFAAVARSGETTAAAFQRLSSVFAVTNRAADLTGHQVKTAFGEIGLASSKMRENLIQAAGGIDTFSAQMQSYADNYLLESERRARTENEIRKALLGVNVALPSSRLAFRQLVESLDLSTEHGQQAYTALMSVGEAFAKITPEIDAVALASGSLSVSYDGQLAKVKKLIDDNKKWLDLRNSAGNLLDSIDNALGKTPQFAAQRQAELWAQMSGASIEQQIALAGDLSSLILDRYQLEKTNLEALRDTAKSLRQYVLGLKVGDLSPYTMGEKLAEAASQYAITFAQAKTGDQTALSALQGRADAYLGVAKDYYASGADYRQIFDSVSTGLDQLGVTLYDSSTASDNAAASQLAELQRLRDAVSSTYAQSASAYQQTNSQLQSEFGLLSQMAAQLGKLSDIAGLLAGLPAGIAANLQGFVSGSGGVGAAKEQVYQTDYGYRYDSTGGAYATMAPNDSTYTLSGTSGAAISGAAAVQWFNEQLARGDGVAVYNAAKQNGISSTTLDTMMGWTAGTANSWAIANNLPKFAVGTNFIPADMPAIVHEGERIMPAADNRRLFDLLERPADMGNADELRRELAELKQLTSELLGALINVTAGATMDSAERIVSAIEKQSDGQAWRERSRPVLS